MGSSVTEPRPASTPRRVRPLALDDFEAWRRGVTRWAVFLATLLVAYWVMWFVDRGVVASDHTAEYVAFEQSFPVADAWLLAALLAAATQLTRRRPSALMWVSVVGGAGGYLAALDMLYDVEHGIYVKPQGGAIELGINVLTAASSIGILMFGWRFRRQLAGGSLDP